MLCTSIQADNSVPDWGKLTFRASFVQVKFVSLETVRFDSSKVKNQGTNTGGPATGNSAQTKTSTGTQNVTQVSKAKGKNGVFQKGLDSSILGITF